MKYLLHRLLVPPQRFQQLLKKNPKRKEVRTIEVEAKQQLMEKLDKNLLDHAAKLADGNGPQIVDGVASYVLYFLFKNREGEGEKIS